MVHLLVIKVNSKEIDGVPVTGTPVGSRTVLGVMNRNNSMQERGI